MEPPNHLTLIYDLARGPLVWAACIFFLFGAIFQVFKLTVLTQVENRARLKPGDRRFLPERSKKEMKKNWGLASRLSILGVNPFMVIITTLFHLLLMVMPFLPRPNFNGKSTA